MGIRFERLSQQNLHRLIPLYRKGFGKRVSMQFLRDRYRPFGSKGELFGHLAYDGKQLIGCNCVIPSAICTGEKRELSAYGLDAVTLPAWRGRGVYLEADQKNMDILSSAGFLSVWSNLSDQLRMLYGDRGRWQAMHRMKAYIIPLMHPYRAAIRREWLKLRGQNPISVFEPWRRNPDPTYSFNINEYVLIDRSDSILKEKQNRGSVFISLESCSVWFRQLNAICIGDMVAPDQKAFDACIARLISLAKDAGAPRIVFQSSPGSPTEQYFASRFPAIDTWVVGFRSLGSAFDPEKLKITWGDADTF